MRTVVVFLVVLASLFGQTTNSKFISHEIDAYANIELDRTLGVGIAARGIYSAVLFEHLRLSAGLSLLASYPSVDGYFLAVSYENILGTGLAATIKILDDISPQYVKSANTIMPYASWRFAFVVADLGFAFRFLVADAGGIWNIFYYNAPVIEGIIMYRLGFTFSFFDDFYTATGTFANFDDFYTGNLGTFIWKLRNEFSVNKELRIFGDIILRPAGTIALSSTFSALIINAGVRVKL